MKFIHLADLHIGKRIANYSLLEDQEYIFNQIVKIAEAEKPNGFFICGDVFDRSVPSEEAIKLYDSFITRCSRIAPVYMIAGNHDSGKRLELFKDLLEPANIYIEGTYKEKIRKEIRVIDGKTVNIFMLPFFNPTEIRYQKGEKIKTYQEALDLILKETEINPDEINILLTHQFYTNNRKQENSELALEMGHLEEISIDSLKDFDFAALGHIHNQQQLGSSRISYSGSPLKFTLNDRKKYLHIVTIDEEVKIDQKELSPLREIYQIDDIFENLINQEEINEDYVVINLLDDRIIPNVKTALLKKFPNLVQIKFNINSIEENDALLNETLSQDPIELLSDFFKSNQKTLTSDERELAKQIFDELEEERNEATLS